MNKRLRLAVRNAVCDKCKMHRQADPEDVCVTGQGPNGARVVVVTRTPLAPDSRARQELMDYFADVGLDGNEFMWCSAIKCNAWDLDPTKTDLKACSPYLREEFRVLDPEYVITFGAEAWFAASGWADITKNRGKLFNVTEGNGLIFPTISPAAVARSPGMRGGFLADLHYFARLVRGDDGETPPFHTNDGRRTRVTSKEGLRATLAAVRDAVVVAYDVETTGAAEYESGAAIVSIALTTSASGTEMLDPWTYEIPLYHPESPGWMRDAWQAIVRAIIRSLKRVPKVVAHNAKFDTKWMRHAAKDAEFIPTFDTIVAAAILDENRPKGLKELSQMLLGADPWGIDTKDLLNTPLDDVMEYNGLDTWHDLRLYYRLRADLLAQPRLARLFRYLMMPLVQELVPVEMRGVYVDQDRLMTNWNITKSKLDDIHNALAKFVPKDHPYIVRNNKTGEIKSDGVNWNASNFARWFLFDHLGLPVLARGKAKDDGSPGAPSMAEDIIMVLAEQHPAAKLLLDRVTVNKHDTSFFRPWSEQVDDNSRIHSTFKPWGTVTGRMSSGKEDREKVTASKSYRGVNLQQVPRDKLLRGVFGAAPGYVFIEADYSQVELRIAAFLANELTMLHLYNTGQDIHMAMAMRMTGKPASRVTAEERKRAKAVNFGFLYGMGWRKFIQTAWSNYGLRVTEEEAKAFRTAFFDEFPMLLPWHAQQRRLAYKYGRVETPMGRVRHLPDIYSPDEGVRAEAERQAINSPVQALASDMASLSLIRTARTFRREDLRAYPIAAVHDAVNFEVHTDDAPYVMPIIKHTMENLPLQRMFGINLTVPIVADLKVGTHWGGATELSDVSMLDRPDDLAAWIDEVIAA